MAVLKKFQQISAKTKILLFALLLIILPSGYLGYLGYRSLEDRELHLKDNYRGMARLLRDQLEGKIKSLEQNFTRNLEALEWSADVPGIQDRLRDLKGQYPFIGRIFVYRSQGSIIHPDVHLGGPSSDYSAGIEAYASSSSFISSGEQFEFVENDLERAIFFYRRAMEQASSIQVRAYARMLIARCYFKMKNFRQAVDNYSLLTNSDEEARSEDGTPLKIIGLSQLSESFSRLGQNQDHYLTLFDLYTGLLATPSGFDSYDFYLQNVKDELARVSQNPDWDDGYRNRLDELEETEKGVMQTVRFLELFRSQVAVRVDMDVPFSREIIQNEEGSSFQVAVVALSPSDSQTSPEHLVYEIDSNFVLANILPEVGNGLNIGGSIRIGIVGEEGSFVFPEETPSPSLGLASEMLAQFFPAWRLVLFDTSGKTVEDIIRKEKFLYGGALFGVFILIMGGAGLTLRAAMHEAEAARIKSEFVSNVSHELKTPLALIRLFGETLEMDDIQDKKKRQKFSRIITRETKRLSHLVENVLDFSKIDAGRKEYNFEEADIVQVVSHTVEAYKYYLKDQDFEFVSSIPDNPILMRMDKDAISQALLNLVSNAEKFSNERKYIGVKVSQKDGEVWIHVEDKGPGIPKSRVERIFDKFDRGIGELAREVQGSGLGLTITKHIVENHGGRIDVESNLGEGSCFIIKLPLKREKR